MSSSIPLKSEDARRRVSPVLIVALAQLFGTSLWFSANAAADDLKRAWGIGATEIGWLTSAVQLGFITGTLTLALGGLADRFKASRLFVVSAILGALFNLAFAYLSTGLLTAIMLRYCVGICLAGIYPVGMKLVVSWAPQQRGAALSLLVAMLTLGTALPQALHLASRALPWTAVMTAASVLAFLAAALISWLGDGPYLSAPSRNQEVQTSILRVFKLRAFRAGTFGYFGHMWELYAFWALVPALIAQTHLADRLGVSAPSLIAFVIIGIGALGCIGGGMASRLLDSARVAAISLLTSGLCCVVFALTAGKLDAMWLFALLLVWGATVIADSPQFSAISSQACPPELVGGALAIQNAIGFAMTVVSISLTAPLVSSWGVHVAWLLVPGPILGLLGMRPLLKAPVA
ncbi:MFS transporter [Paraburkholderia ginsengiterrae]|uniref:MFS transporter n=1 Tax=Paraburkholderia ginsengiterrae TaxID=1462993 RepID=A0A1A9N2F6_9BURK|nr:MFS transporter [Paraburkholderia ginsengiterrae]OAJ55988.1 MFS transporter [Paraburkholderia ginsengiterrae]OAJ58554.1 MFS transporter [Paraburkholderia ginsengiterrae]